MAENKNPSREDMIRMRIVFSVPGMDAVNVRRDVIYKSAQGEPLHMDIYSPPGEVRSRPVVILVHGGPIPRMGAKRMGVFVSYGELLAASGFVAVTFDHRFLAPVRLADAGGDVTDAIVHVRTNADSLGVDPERVALWAFSGGGPFLASPLRERPAWLRAVVAYYAALDLPEPESGQASENNPELRQEFSPTCSLAEDARKVPPVFVARAGLDHPWLNSTIDRFVQVALTQRAMLDVLTHPDGHHGFDILDDDFRSKQIIRRTLEFLRDNLGS
jgi:acetyl esterase/lipase